MVKSDKKGRIVYRGYGECDVDLSTYQNCMESAPKANTVSSAVKFRAKRKLDITSLTSCRHYCLTKKQSRNKIEILDYEGKFGARTTFSCGMVSPFSKWECRVSKLVLWTWAVF
jgi:hypothetical protein